MCGLELCASSQQGDWRVQETGRTVEGVGVSVCQQPALPVEARDGAADLERACGYAVTVEVVGMYVVALVMDVAEIAYPRETAESSSLAVERVSF